MDGDWSPNVTEQAHVLDWVVGKDGVRSALVRLYFDVEDESGRTIFNVDEGRLDQRSVGVSTLCAP